MSWKQQISGLGDLVVKSFAIDPSDSQTLYAGTLMGGVYKSHNGGNLWNPLITGLEEFEIATLSVDPKKTNILFAGTLTGVYKMNQTATSVREMTAQQPAKFSLEQNYPNPFNPSTEIQFFVAEPATIDIVVFDVLGNKVTQLVDKQFSPGQYVITWDGTDFHGNSLASGIYFYRMTSAGFTKMRRMVLTR